ncbi:oligosaccharide flippase family protein [Bacillus thuringiensis]|uniref:oligosaccharide flippase family protein n=2 Tax=Bacillus thuringiensis TaxID=1428 RepID=UPI002ABC1A3E|nr:oligosaccharide flippase family protein [Bacillus thuringiensis]MDZ3954910.1 oligosaccharide flippase family protein [Bacillus thuringiensis]
MSLNSNKLISSGTVYFIFSILTQLINMLLIPLYTSNLSQNDYGKYELLNTIQQLLGLAITIGVYSGLKRFFYDVENKITLKNTALNFSVLWGIVVFSFVYFISPLISDYVFSGDNEVTLYIRVIVITSLLTCLIAIYTSYYEMEFKAFRVAIVQLSILILTFLLATYYILILGNGIIGILKATLISNLLVFIVLFILDFKNYKITIHVPYLKNILYYGGGLLLGQISAWILNLIDRFFIKELINYSAVAVYSISSKIGMLINPVFITPFAQVFTAYKFKVYKEEGGQQKIQNMFRIYNIVGCFCIFGLAIFGKIAISILATNEYLEAYKIIPLIAISHFIWGIGQFYSLGLHVANKMMLNSLIVVISALINIVLNILLIPHLGINGAALATIVSYIVANILYYYFSEKYYSLGLGLLYPYKYFAIFVLLYGVYWMLISPIQNLYIEFICNVFLCIVYVLLLIVFKFTNIQEIRGFLLSIVKKK